MKTNKSIVLTTLILVTLCSSSCSIINFLFSKSKPSYVRHPKLDILPNENNFTSTPQSIESEAQSYYNSACNQENHYYNTNEIRYANVAIDYFEKYYNKLPNGGYAGLALLKIAELSYHIGDIKRAYFELDRIKRNSKLRVEYREEIKLIENLVR